MAVEGLVDFCLTEIALEGFEGCPITNLFDLLYQSAQTLSTGRDDDNYENNFVKIKEFFRSAFDDFQARPELRANYENYLWRLLVAQIELDFYVVVRPGDKTTPSTVAGARLGAGHIVSETNAQGASRGVCRNYASRRYVTDAVRGDPGRSFQSYAGEFGARLVVVASQTQRNRVLCPSFKHLGLESLTDIEYCVLEAIGKKRFEGAYTTGDDGLTTLFALAPKQLHYILVILEGHHLVKKQPISSQKKRLIVHLVAYSQKTKSLLECVCEHLMQKNLRSGGSSGEGYCDTLVNIKRRFFLASKRFKNLMQSAERQSILKRYIETREYKSKSKTTTGGGVASGSKRSSAGTNRTRQVRMIKLTDSYYKQMLANYNTSTLASLQTTSASAADADESALGGDEDENGAGGGDLDSKLEQSDEGVGLIDAVGSQQSVYQSLYAQIFAKIEQSGKEGISLKRLGTIFGFDFYKSRRIGAHLQTHPEVVTIIKETDRGKAKYQTIALRKFLSATLPPTPAATSVEPAAASDQASTESSPPPAPSPLSSAQAGLTVVKYVGCNKPSQSIQAVMSNRMLARKQLILDYIAKHRICTKYEITKEIKSVEAEQGLKGVIDSKTTKRMLLDLEKDGKLVVFDVNLKNVCYMGVRACDIAETDDEYIKYRSTFKRTFDSVDIKVKSELSLNESAASEAASESLNTSAGSQTSPSKSRRAGKATTDAASASAAPRVQNETDASLNDSLGGGEQNQFKLTKSFIQATVEPLKFSTNFSKVYALVPKYQKTIILHRLLQYLLFFYDGRPQHLEPRAAEHSQIVDRVNQPLSAMTTNPMYSTERRIVDSCLLPALGETFQPLMTTHADWRTYIPPLERAGSASSERHCIFIGEIFSHMPLSVFSAIIVINHQVPGLVALLKHPFKRHILVKDLPPNLIAPLIYERRYLQRMLGILQNLACLGLVTFVPSPCKTNQAPNRDVQSQMIYVHRKAEFFDTTANKCASWDELQRVSKYNFGRQSAPSVADESGKLVKYDKYQFEFNSDDDVTDFWRKLLHVSMNTYGFNSSRHLKEDKRSRQKLMAKVLEKVPLESISELKTMTAYSDCMGPGGYDSQLFLNSIKNWMLPSNLSHAATAGSLASKSEKRRLRRGGAETDAATEPESAPAITKEDDLTMAPYSELALSLGFYRGIGKSGSGKRNRAAGLKSKAATAKRLRLGESADEAGSSLSEDEDASTTTTTRKPAPAKKPALKFKSTLDTATNLKIMKAKTLIDKARMYKATAAPAAKEPLKPESGGMAAERRAIWSREEDELILLIKVTSLYFFPNEKRITFKLISDIMHEIVPDKCHDKKVSSYGRRIKALLKSNLNLLFVSNKLELCKQDKEIEKKYAKALAKLKRNLVDHEQIEIYKSFVVDLRDKFLKRSYSGEAGESAGQQDSATTSATCAAVIENEPEFELPKTLEEFNRKYKIKNTLSDLFSNQNNDYKQPKSDYEISFNTLHSAIHSSILINDKTPRLNESLNLFDKYSDQLLTDVIMKMSRSHKIIAATKFSEMKKKNVTAFSKHIGKAFHISQRYQYKWNNSQVSSNVLVDTAKFKNSFVENELRQRLPPAQSTAQKRVKFSLQTAAATRPSQPTEMFDCSDKDDLGMASFLAHTLDNPSIQVLVDVPNKIFESKLF